MSNWDIYLDATPTFASGDTLLWDDVSQGADEDRVRGTTLTKFFAAAADALDFKAGEFQATADTELTVSAGGEITVTQTAHKLQPNGGTADDLDTISGTNDGGFYIFFASDKGTDTITFKHEADNISCFGGSDLDLIDGAIWAYSDGTTVYCVGGGGGGVTLTGVETLTNKRITPRVTDEASSATPTINTDNSDVHRITALATAITSMTTNLSGTETHGQKLIVEILDNGTSRAITHGASFRSTDIGTLPTATTISKLLRVGYMYDTADSIWECVAVSNEA